MTRLKEQVWLGVSSALLWKKVILIGSDPFACPLRNEHSLVFFQGCRGAVIIYGWGARALKICPPLNREAQTISSFDGQTWTSMKKPQILDIWLLIRLVLVLEIDEGDLTDTIPFYRMKIGPLSMQ